MSDSTQALPQGGSPPKPDELRGRFDTFLNDGSKGKDSITLRFVIKWRCLLIWSKLFNIRE